MNCEKTSNDKIMTSIQYTSQVWQSGRPLPFPSERQPQGQRLRNAAPVRNCCDLGSGFFSGSIYTVRVAKRSSSANFAQSRSCVQPCYRPFTLIFEVSLQSLSSDLLKPYALRLLSKVRHCNAACVNRKSFASPKANKPNITHSLCGGCMLSLLSELMLATLPNHHATPSTPRNSNLRIQKLGFPTMARRISLTACWDCAALLQLETRSIPVMRLGDFFLVNRHHQCFLNHPNLNRFK